MPVVVTAADRASFARCRRQWDFGAGIRRDLEPLRRPAVPDLDRAVRDALAVYYFPGMWDWDRGVRLPLVVQELERALARQRQHGEHQADGWQEALDEGKALLNRYFAWAPGVDRFAPVLVETDFEVDVLDPATPDTALVTTAGDLIRYSGRIDMMAVDARDAYWIVRHRVLGLGAFLHRDGHHRHHLQRAAPPVRPGRRALPAPAAAGQKNRAPAALAGPIRPPPGTPARAERRRPVHSPAPPDVRPGPGAQAGRAPRAARDGRLPPHLAAPRSGRREASRPQARRRRSRDDPRGPRYLPRAFRRQVPAVPLPRAVPGHASRPGRRTNPPDGLPQAPARTPGGRTPRRTRLEPGPRRRPAEVPASAQRSSGRRVGQRPGAVVELGSPAPARPPAPGKGYR